jgi:hypothetical protein
VLNIFPRVSLTEPMLSGDDGASISLQCVSLVVTTICFKLKYTMLLWLQRQKFDKKFCENRPKLLSSATDGGERSVSLSEAKLLGHDFARIRDLIDSTEALNIGRGKVVPFFFFYYLSTTPRAEWASILVRCVVSFMLRQLYTYWI